MSSPAAYRVSDYGDMVTSEPRMGAYAEALRRAVSPGCRVLDIGAGPGIFSILACRYGAGSVVAVEPGDIAGLIPALAKANGCRDKISVFKGLSTDYAGPKADLVISDLRGRLPLFEGHVEAIIDARERLLAPNGQMIPRRDVLRIAVVNNPKSYIPIEAPWLENQYELDLSAGHRFAANEWSAVHLEADAMLTDIHDLAVLDYRAIADANLASAATLPIMCAGVAHGLLLWFDADLGEGLGFSNAPGCPRQIYGQTFFPFEAAVDVAPGDRVIAEIEAKLIDGAYVWNWNSRFWKAGAAETAAGFRQSSFLAKVMSPESLRTRAGNYSPPISEALAVDRLCLSMVDGHRTLAEIAEEIREQCPARFASSTEALNHVTKLANRYL